MNAAVYLERTALVLELRGILEDPTFAWIHEAKTPDGKIACRLVRELLERQPPASVAELEGMLIRILEYHLQYAGGV